jgi:hypothetical protein
MDYLTHVFQLHPAVKEVASPPRPRTPLSCKFGPDQFGSFRLTHAIRPTASNGVRPVQGFRYDKYHDQEYRTEIPVIMAAASGEILFPLFVQLVQRLGETVDVVLETSHEHESTGHRDLYREQIELPILTSALWDYEDLLLNDGCTGIAVINSRTPQEIQFDEHKMLILYGQPLETFEQILEEFEIPFTPEIRFITEGEHVHASSAEYLEEFQRLAACLGTEPEGC